MRKNCHIEETILLRKPVRKDEKLQTESKNGVIYRMEVPGEAVAATERDNADMSFQKRVRLSTKENKRILTPSMLRTL